MGASAASQFHQAQSRRRAADVTTKLFVTLHNVIGETLGIVWRKQFAQSQPLALLSKVGFKVP
jgi:hypothetical protein